VRVLAGRAGLGQRHPETLTGEHVQAMSDMEFLGFIKNLLASLVKRAGPEGAIRHVLSGKEIETMSDADLFHLVQKVSVYARVSPQHKLRIRRTWRPSIFPPCNGSSAWNQFCLWSG
jgi:Ca2+-transporting ATPase